MKLRRLHTALIAPDELATLISNLGESVVLWCVDADTIMVAASLSGQLSGPVGVWLEVSNDYPASLAARDVATLSCLVPLRDVVISAVTMASAHAAVVRALLTNDEVNFENAVATLRGAYNRPAPPSPVSVWSYDGTDLVALGVTLRVVAREDLGERTVLTDFADATPD